MTAEFKTSVSEYLHGKILEYDEIEAFLNALARLAVHELSADGEEVLCGITLLRYERAGTVASSSQEAQELDEVQYDYRDGPCLSAARRHVMVEVPDLNQEVRWPEYVQAVTRRGIRSVLAIPLPDECGDGAALNLYSTVPAKFTPDRVELAQAYAQEASQALALAMRPGVYKEGQPDALEAMRSRTTIDLAVGMIMGQDGCSQEEAFTTLRSASSSRNIKLREVASGVVGPAGFGSGDRALPALATVAEQGKSSAVHPVDFGRSRNRAP